MKCMINFIDLTNIKQTDGKINSKAGLFTSYIFFISLLTILISTTGYLPFFCLYTKIKSFISIFIFLIILVHAYSIISSEKNLKYLLITKKCFYSF